MEIGSTGVGRQQLAGKSENEDSNQPAPGWGASTTSVEHSQWRPTHKLILSQEGRSRQETTYE